MVARFHQRDDAIGQLIEMLLVAHCGISRCTEIQRTFEATQEPASAHRIHARGGRVAHHADNGFVTDAHSF